MDNVEITLSRESAIMAYRIAPNRRWVWPLIGGGVLAAILFVVLLGGWLLLRQPLNVPAQTALLVSLSPSQARAIPPAYEANLPPLWRTALQGQSRWHVLLGAYLDASGWHSFAIVPRWRQKEFSQTIKEEKGLLMLVTDTESLSADKSPLRYFDLGSGKARLNLPVLPAFANLASSEFDLPKAIDITWKENVFETSLPLSDPSFEAPLKQTDLSLIIGGQSSPILDEVMVGKWPLTHFLPGPLQLNVQSPQSATGVHLEAIYQKSLTVAQAKLLLAGLFQNPTTPLTLPDGTVVLEDRAPSINSEIPINLRRLPSDFGSIDIQDRTFRIGMDGQTFPDAKSACSNLKPYARLSSYFVGNIFAKLGFSNANPESGVQIGSYKQHLTVCLE